MTLEKHIADTMKEWQIKMGSLDSNVRLYYPKTSLCRYLNLNIAVENEVLCRYIEKYFADNVKYLGKVEVSAAMDRFCIMVGKEGCNYVEENIPEPEFLAQFLIALKSKNLEKITDCFEEYAGKHGTICVCNEVGETETVLYFENEAVEPYVYCIDKNEFGITYHRFAKDDYMDLY